ncbi:MAG TPA: class I SAM-dependent methyltransferase [Pyrinomonadaceae bacterium]|nr:class I SAM-dependent methyltransferase [Pyrinomonadaceae bacterium]
MPKTQKELAFLRDLYINDEWTRRFTDLVDKHVDVSGLENLLYINAGTGNHCFALREKAGDHTAIFATCEDEHLLSIARDKAIAVKSDVDFSMIRFEEDSFDSVIADASFVNAEKLEEFVEEAVRVAKPGADVAVMFVSAGSFGEVFSLLWEVFFQEDLGEHGHAAETMISALPTSTIAEEIGGRVGLVNIQTHSANEVFEYENGGEFIASPLIADFLLPEWLKTLEDTEKERVSEKLAQLVDSEDGTMTFRFSVKATLLTGEKG